ncbi:MAG: single-stranded-DNA-specific exonuclease RecJ [Candidatus Moranbacteria bacterium]|nr:single-stranded-DNA-specific exonuclease RecJ [Candidatus Moranbacteria bacterium]
MQEAVQDILKELLKKRGITTKEEQETFLNPNYETDLHDPFLFHQMHIVVKRVMDAHKKNQKIMIFGDFDVDGVTGATILKEGLENLGISAQVYIPDKKTEGHGLNMYAINQFKKEGFSLLITVDCGVTNHNEIEQANKDKIDTIVIDHHHIPPTLPPAHAVINAQMKESGYPFRGLCGAGTAFKVIQALYHEMAPERIAETKWLLDLAATGTVADCVPLIGENRTIVRFGLIVLARTRRMGLRELYDIGGMKIDESNVPNTELISFQIAPRINAAGRMAHAQMAHDLLIEKNQEKAREIAEKIDQHNKDRRKISDKISQAVLKIANKEFLDKKIVVAVSEDFPIGIVGLVAGRVASQTAKPTAVFTKKEKESQGSFRSVPGVSIIKALHECEDLLVKFGGHEQAAGATIKNENFEKFVQRLDKIITKMMGEKIVVPELKIDAQISLNLMNEVLAKGIESMAPFGEGNREPILLIQNLILAETRSVGTSQTHAKVMLAQKNMDKTTTLDGIGFSLAQKCEELKGEIVDVVCTISENHWNGKVTTQAKIIDIKKNGKHE